MTKVITCDYCAETIEHDDRQATLEVHYCADAILTGARSGWVGHYHTRCYNKVEDAIKAVHLENRPPPPPPWKERPPVEREHLVLNALGEDRLSLGELVPRVREQAGDDQIWDSYLKTVVNRLIEAGELERVKERRCRGDHPSAFTNRYFRRRDLDGPIADLDRRLSA
ncbi:MAG: hypothetical protein QOJ97_101 [Solirubrobacteraceae bacterium]|jgi:hypothetical protein|nr:hypothetical protein [Solirubrobacteraceae bacterium]